MLTMLLYALGCILALSGMFCTLLGLLTVFYWCKPPNHPADSSNRLNNVASWWIGLTRQEVVAECYKYFRQDVMDNVKDVDKAAMEEQEDG